MTKQKSKVLSKHPIQRRTTFKKHPRHYAKVYAPYLPAIVGLVVGLSIIFGAKDNSSKSVLSYASSTSVNSLLKETNDKRADNKSPLLNLSDSLESAAQLKAQDMASRNYWSHVTPDGKQPWYFIEQAGYGYSTAAENLAYGFNSSGETVSGWMNSPEHRKAMLDANMREVGFGIANVANYQNKGPETIVVALYASPMSPSSKVNSQFIDKPANAISFGQVITAGSLPWVNLAAGILIGLIAMYILTKHSLKLRRRIRQGEQYVLHHPVVDVSLLAILILMIAISQTAGFIH